MPVARLPAIAVGNGRLLATVDSQGEVLSACWPRIDSPNQFTSFCVRPVSGGAFIHRTSNKASKRLLPKYLEDTNIASTLSLEDISFTDLVVDYDSDNSQVDLLVRKVSGPHPAMTLYVEPSMDGRPGSQTIYWDQQSEALFAFCRRRWVAIGSSRGRITDFHCGRLGSDSSARLFTDCDSFPAERIAFRQVDAVVRFEASVGDTLILSVFGRTREEVLEGLNARREQPWNYFEDVARLRAAEVLVQSTLQGWSPNINHILRRSSLVWDVLSNRETGGIIAGPDVQSGIASAPGYAAFWARDAAWTLLGALAMGEFSLSKRILDFAWETQSPEGLWLHRHHTDHSVASSWGLHQIDETGIILYGVEKYIEATGDFKMLDDHWAGIERAAEFLLNSRDKKTCLPLPTVDLWEEREGLHIYTAASTIAGLRAAVSLSAKTDAQIRSSVERWSSAADEMLQQTKNRFWDEAQGRFLSSLETSSALPMVDPDRPELSASVQEHKVKPPTSIPQYPNWRDHEVEQVIYRHDISTLALTVPFNILPATDWQIVKTAESIRSLLLNDHVGGLHRYEGDSYGGGNPWPLATLWLAIYESQRGHTSEARRLVEWVVDHSTEAGLVPEQVHRTKGNPVASVPLSWSHAMIALAVARCQNP